MPAESLAAYRDMMLGDVVNGPRGKTAHEWAPRQSYIALGNLMTAAAVLGVDACPMEGLVPAEYDKIFGLDGSGYTTVVALRAGLSRGRRQICVPGQRSVTGRRTWCA